MNRLQIIILAACFTFISCEKLKNSNSGQTPATAVQVPNEPSANQIIQIKKLSPFAFPSLPKDIQSFLVSGGYTIPQLAEEKMPTNVISGSFISPRQVDWAVLGSCNGESEILIFHNGSTQSMFRIGKRKDDEIRFISVATPAFIKEHYSYYGGPKPPDPLDHDGIDDGLDGKASGVWYFYNQQWLGLQGAD